MTHTVTSPLRPRATSSRPVDSERPARRLRTVLLVNAATSFGFGIAGLVAAPYWSEALGIDSVGWIRLVSAGLVLFAVDVALVAWRAKAALPTAVLAISAGDLTWVVATGVALATVSFTTTGWILAVVIGIGVLDYALLQLWYRSRLA